MALFKKLLSSGSSSSSGSSAEARSDSFEVLEGRWQDVHGFRGDTSWEHPRLAAKSNESNRADQGNDIKVSCGVYAL
jgi:hypothetical protein